jgi:hypothetical protein
MRPLTRPSRVAERPRPSEVPRTATRLRLHGTRRFLRNRCAGSTQRDGACAGYTACLRPVGNSSTPKGWVAAQRRRRSYSESSCGWRGSGALSPQQSSSTLPSRAIVLPNRHDAADRRQHPRGVVARTPHPAHRRAHRTGPRRHGSQPRPACGQVPGAAESAAPSERRVWWCSRTATCRPGVRRLQSGSPAYSPWRERAPSWVGQPDSRTSGWTAPAPASRGCPLTAVSVQPDPRTSSTSSTGP